MDYQVKALFLCTELAGYFNACISFLRQSTGASVRVYHWPKVASAPFEHQLPGIELIEKLPDAKNTLLPACIDFNPTLIYVGGWVDRDYLQIARHFKNKGIPVVSGLDNVWKGTLRQKLSALFSGKIVRPYFTHLWVAGSRQYQFARQLGYAHNQILHDIYTADVTLFAREKKEIYGKYLLYVGRFEKEKGVDILFHVFNSLTDEERNGWKLRMIGNGSLRQIIKGNATVVVEDFMQPETLINANRNAGGFILPSLEEPWGVVVQEFAAAMLPLILSDEVNAGEKYLIHNYNGFKFKSNDKTVLKNTLIRFFKLSQDELRQMGERSHKLAIVNDQELWASRFLSVISDSSQR